MKSVFYRTVQLRGLAKTIEDFHNWGDVIITGTLAAVNSTLKNVTYMLEGLGRFGHDSSRLSLGRVRGDRGYPFNKHSNTEIGCMNNHFLGDGPARIYRYLSFQY